MRVSHKILHPMPVLAQCPDRKYIPVTLLSTQLSLFPKVTGLKDCSGVRGQVLHSQSAPVICICDHAIAVEHSADVLLGPVTIRQLLSDQKLCRAFQWLRLTVSSCKEGQQGPARIYHLGIALAVNLILAG